MLRCRSENFAIALKLWSKNKGFTDPSLDSNCFNALGVSCLDSVASITSVLDLKSSLTTVCLNSTHFTELVWTSICDLTERFCFFLALQMLLPICMWIGHRLQYQSNPAKHVLPPLFVIGASIAQGQKITNAGIISMARKHDFGKTSWVIWQSGHVNEVQPADQKMF